MIIIIPIGGIGQRFKDNGYKKPKALINIYGRNNENPFHDISKYSYINFDIRYYHDQKNLLSHLD